MKSTSLLFLSLFSCLLLGAQNISIDAAKADLQAFKDLLEVESSYFQIHKLNLDSLLNQELKRIDQNDSIPIIELAYFLQEVMYTIKDSHASVRFIEFDQRKAFQYRKRFPFATAPYKDKVVALQRTSEYKKFEYYNPNYPFLKSINHQAIHPFLEYYSFDNNRFPQPARLKKGLNDLRRIGDLYTRRKETLPDSLHIVLSNGQNDTTIYLNPHSKNNTWRYPGNLRELPIRSLMKNELPFQYDELIPSVDDDVAYMMIPKMISYEDYPDFEVFFENYLTSLKTTNPKGLILDIRGNSGGSRDLIYTLSKFIIPKDQSPWVANMAFIRSDQYLNEAIESMSEKRLFTYNSDHFNETDRQTIDEFTTQLEPKFQFDSTKFSKPYFMVLNHHDTLHLAIPIYILCDEGSFSAASIMASVFKGLKNVQLCGTTTNGSSGRSRYFFLPTSNIRVKLSTMLSFQRNGYPLDGYGTTPDILLERDELQILGQQDSQLLKLIEMIKMSTD